MSLFDLQDVRIAIGSIATLDLPMVVDLIGIYGLKGPYFALVMSLFDLQDVRIAIGSIATLDLPMVVDLIGIYGLKGPYCTLTTTNWFLQALSVIPRDHGAMLLDALTMIRWIIVFSFGNRVDPSDLIGDRSYDEVSVMGMNRMFIRWTRARWPDPNPSLSLFNIDLGDLIKTLETLNPKPRAKNRRLPSLKRRRRRRYRSPEVVPANLSRRIRPRRSRQAF
ncbi:hypothetical protein F511_32668 [Dorcoceras hygrometricum]|uniref:Uncharacterized protein n=1 Tax=Dorcoceras hygrometricum TaxID=472368 RepID=A0A2Z7AH05_9LAMI|nr:hypothetical protein F511_32668 [Dorcoceras hygrometricum]